MTALKRRYLKEMGIDVWVSRNLAAGLSASADQPVAEQAAPAPAASAPGPAAAAPSTPSQDASPAFNLCFVTGGDYALIFELPSGANAARCRRLCDDIVFAVTGKSSTGTSMLERPKDSVGHVAQDEAAREAVRRKMEDLPGRVIVFGERARDYVSGSQDDIVQQGDRTVLGVPAVMDLIAEPKRKREVWQGILKLA